MNKVLRFTLIFIITIVALFMFTACSNTGKVVSIEVDPTTIENYYDVSSFDVSMVYLILTYENEETERIPLSLTMIKAEDHIKLQVAGDQTITVTYKQRTTTFVIKLRNIADKYEVRFLNEDGTQIGETQFVEPGGTAQSPMIPTKTDYVFDGWKDQYGSYSFYDNINENKVYTATFVPDFCIVKFILETGQMIGEEIKIKKGASVASFAPAFPVIPGKTATGWSRSLDNILEDITITALYIDDTINVYFKYGYDGRAIKEENFPAYSEISPRFSPIVDHAEFLGWYTKEDFSGQQVTFPYLLTNEITFYAKYVSKTIGSEGLEYSDTGNNTYRVSNYTGNDDVIVIPEKYNNLDVVEVLGTAFINSNNSRFYVSESNDYFSITDGVLFDATKSKLIAYPSNKQGDQYALPTGVQSIENYAFAKAKNLFLISFPSSITSIGDYAFYNCSRLISINIPASVESIGEYAFMMEDDSQLNSLTFDANCALEQIGKEAFRGLKRITTITLPSMRLVNIGSSVFYGCELLEEILLEGGNVSNSFRSIDGVLYDNNFTTLIAYPSNSIINSHAAFTVPDGITTIKSGAFINSVITGIRIPSSVSVIEGDAFNSPRLQYIQFLGQAQPTSISETMFGTEFKPAFAIIPAGRQTYFSFFDDLQFIEDNPPQTYYYNAETGYLYTRNEENKLNILALRKPVSDLTIPAEIDGYEIESIGKYAFYNNYAITKVTISEGIERVEKNAFWHAEKLTEITLPLSLMEIESNAFADCISLNVINAGNEILLETLGQDAFIETPWYEKSIEEFLIIGNILVKYNGKGDEADLTSIPEISIKIIADNAFMDKTNLRRVILNEGLEKINSYAFYGCSSLFYIELPPSVEYIGELAFYNCPKLYRIIMKSQYPPELSTAGEIFTTNAVYTISNEEHSFSIMVPYNDNSTYLNRYLNEWEQYTGYFLQVNESTVSFSSPNAPQESITTNTLYEPLQPLDRPGYVFAGWYEYDNVSEQKINDPIVFPLQVQGETPFFSRWFNENEGVDGIEYILINDGTEYAVSRYAGSLKYVVIPNSYKDKPVTKILAGAFLESANSINPDVYQIVLPSTITEIEEDAFSETKWYSQFLGDFLYINDILIEYKGIEDNVVVPDFINHIVPGAFENNENIKSISFPEDIKILPSKLMYNCINLESVILPTSVEEIHAKAFMNCPKLNFNQFPYSLANIAPDALLDTYWYNNFVDDLVTINGILYKYRGVQPTLHIPNTIIKIEREAFKDNVFLQNLYISNTVMTIEESAFENCIVMQEVIFAQNPNILEIGARAFYGCLNMEVFNLGENSIQRIGDYAFSVCSKLSRADFPSTLIYLGKGAYSKSGIISANFAANSQLRKIEEDTFKDCGNLRTFVYGANSFINSIATSAFENCGNLMSVIIPNSNRLFMSIEMNAFKNCKNLVNVTLPTSLMEIGDDAFMDVPYLDSNKDEIMTVGSVLLKYTGEDPVVVISQEIAAISKGAFEGNEILRSVVFEEGSQLFAIGEDAFKDCINLESINLPLSLNFVGKDAFYNTRWLNDYIDDFVIVNDILIKYKGDDYQAIIPNNVTTIGIEAFAGNTKLRNIEVGQNVVAIMARAFNGMSENSTITMLRTIPPQLDADNDIVSLIYVENTTIFNNYREDEVWLQYVNSSEESIMKKFVITFNLVYTQEVYLEELTNALFEEPAPSREGYTFIGWYEEDENGVYGNLISLPYVLTADITVYAKWIDNQTGTEVSDLSIKGFAPSGADEGSYIIGYSGFDRYVMIPAEYGEEAIIGIAKNEEFSGNAFANNTTIEEVVFVQGYFDGGNYVLGSQLRYIMEGSFQNCTSLRRIVLPATLMYIGPNAFAGCTSLEEVIFTGGGENGLVIDENAFNGCTSLKTITFEDNLISIGIDAFKGCEKLTKIYMNGDIPPQISNNPFEFTNGLEIYVNKKNDDSVLNLYKAQWANYDPYIVNKPE